MQETMNSLACLCPNCKAENGLDKARTEIINLSQTVICETCQFDFEIVIANGVESEVNVIVVG